MKTHLIKPFAALLFALIVSGCATMTFTQDVNRPLSGEKKQHWHNTMLNGIVEISEPTNLYQDCKGKPWHYVEVEYRVKNGLVSGVTNHVLEALLFQTSWFAFYSPWNVEVQCSK